VQARGLDKRGIAAFFYRRDAAAMILMVALWLFGLWARPDFWGGLDNSFAILLAFSEIALLAVGLTFVMANGDIDLSVGSVLAFSGAVAAAIMKDTNWGPLAAVGGGILAGVINGWLTAYVGLPAFIATLGTFYWARGIGSSIVVGTQLNGFPESLRLLSQLHSDGWPVARTRQHLLEIIGGGSIFGGYGTMIGSLAGAAVITLIRSLLSLQIILKDGSSFVLPQQWQNVFIGLILIVAVVGDIWLRQHNILGQWFGRRRIVEEPARVEPVKEAKA
jgi:ribose/xylose/arabinose/galactoside ABC-type transport system permease subunit